MIGKVTGRIAYKALDHVMIETHGIGYLIYCADATLAALPAPGNHASLYTEMLVRQDIMALYGFMTLVEKEWHRLLTSVNGVGSKASLAVLGTLGADGTSRAIALGDWASIKTAPGIGPKIAQRIINELQDKAPQIMSLDTRIIGETVAQPLDNLTNDIPVICHSNTSPPSLGHASRTASAEALSALGNLGYSPSDAAAAVSASAHENPKATTTEMIRAALKRLAPKE